LNLVRFRGAHTLDANGTTTTNCDGAEHQLPSYSTHYRSPALDFAK
jgi:hypothetical protein